VFLNHYSLPKDLIKNNMKCAKGQWVSIQIVYQNNCFLLQREIIKRHAWLPCKKIYKETKTRKEKIQSSLCIFGKHKCFILGQLYKFLLCLCGFCVKQRPFLNNSSGVSLSKVIDHPLCSVHVFQGIVCGWGEQKVKNQIIFIYISCDIVAFCD